MKSETERWQELAYLGKFAQLADETGQARDQDSLIRSALWNARALRAMGRGAEANERLHLTTKLKYTATVEEVAELGEELIQCAYYEEAAVLADLISQQNAPQGNYLWLLLWREREDWIKFHETKIKLEEHGDPWTTIASIQSAWGCLLNDQIEASADHLIKESQNKHPSIQKLIARIEIAQGKSQIAQKRLEQIAINFPNDWEWPCILAACLAANIPKDKSIAAKILGLYDQGLARQPRNPEALANRAKLWLMLGDEKNAEKDCNHALALKPWYDAPVLLLIGKLAQDRKFEAAAHQLALVRNSFDTPKRAGAALDLMRLSGAKKEDLIKKSEELVLRFGNDAVFLRTAGAAMQVARKLDQAVLLYQKALTLNPNDNASKSNLASLYRERGDFEAAITFWRSLKNSSDEATRLNLAHALLERGDLIEAEEIFRKTLSLSPKQPSALRGLADIKLNQGDDEAAWLLGQESVSYDSRNPLAWQVLAGIAKRRSGTQAALNVLEEGLKNATPLWEIRNPLFQNYRGFINKFEIKRKVKSWCEEEPNRAQYWLMAADAELDDNNFELCEARLQNAYQVDRLIGGTALVRFYISRGRNGAARKMAQQLVRDDPGTMKNWGLLAEVLYRQERYDEALEVLKKALDKEPSRLSLLRQKMGILLALERHEEAISELSSFDKKDMGELQIALMIEAYHRGQESHKAVGFVEELLKERPKDRVLRLFYATTLQRVARHTDSLRVLELLYKDEPTNISVVRKYARTLIQNDSLAEAIIVLRKLGEDSGDRSDILNDIAAMLRLEGAIDESRQLLVKALDQTPKNLSLWFQMAELERCAEQKNAEITIWKLIIDRFEIHRWMMTAIPSLVRLGLLKELEAALNTWRIAEIDNPEPWWAAYSAAKAKKDDSLALEFLDKIESKFGENDLIHFNRSDIRQEAWQLGLAESEIRKAIKLKPDSVLYLEKLVSILIKAGNFDDFLELIKRMEHLLGDFRYSRYNTLFFNLNCHPNLSSREIWRFYVDWYERAIKPTVFPPKKFKNTLEPERKLRIGYVSPDFRQHAVAYFSEPLLIEHDREQFELFAYAHLEPGESDKYTEKFKSYFHHWTETKEMGQDEFESRVRNDGIDILIDLAGHTSNNRLASFVNRPAPVQASWIWGAGQTTGLPQVDALLSDSAVVPYEHEKFVTEKLWRIPKVGFPFKPALEALDPQPLPCLTNGFITFGVLCRPVRASQATISVWASILQRVPNSRIRFDHLPYVEEDIQKRIKNYFAEQGISESRLDFRNTRPHWIAYQKIDIQLDAFPAGSGTTATEGLFMERPVIALKSRPPMGRFAHAQLSALGIDEICGADSQEEYIEKAVALASDPVRLATICNGMRDRMQKSWLMDYVGYGKLTATMYRSMWRAYCEQQTTLVSDPPVISKKG